MSNSQNNKWHKYVFLSMPLTTLVGVIVFLLTKDWIWLGGGLAIGVVLQNYFEKKRDS
jgi:hypothetical protein